jgi:hypothetical protein
MRSLPIGSSSTLGLLYVLIGAPENGRLMKSYKRTIRYIILSNHCESGVFSIYNNKQSKQATAMSSAAEEWRAKRRRRQLEREQDETSDTGGEGKKMIFPPHLKFGRRLPSDCEMSEKRRSG